MPWYRTWFDSDAYSVVYDHRDEAEAAALIDWMEEAVAPESGAEILDVGCGRGRHAMELARRGYAVTGLDLSEPSIQEARERADDEGLDVTFRVGDMREPMGEAEFDGVVNLFTAFGYFDDDAESERALQAMATALRPGGWFVQDFLNAPYVIENHVPEDERVVDGITIHQRRWVEDGFIHKEITLRRDGREETFRERVRLFTLYDLKGMYESAGLELINTAGDYDGSLYTPSSPRCITVCRKR